MKRKHSKAFPSSELRSATVPFKIASDPETVSQNGLQLLDQLIQQGIMIPVWEIKSMLADLDKIEGALILVRAKALGFHNAFQTVQKAGANMFALGVRGTSVLHIAVRKKDLKLMKQILDIEVKFLTFQDSDGFTPLHTCTTLGHIDAMKLLIEFGANLNKTDYDYQTSLHHAVHINLPEAVEVLVQCGASINAQDKGGYTPLHLSAGLGHKKCMEVLLKAQPQLEVSVRFTSWRALHSAALFNHPVCMGLLLKKSPKVDAKSLFGMTPLHIAAQYHLPRCTSMLIKAGAKVNIQDNVGCTPLHRACSPYDPHRNYWWKCNIGRFCRGCNIAYRICHHKKYPQARGYQKILSMLLNAGADTEKKSLKGQTALHLAVKMRNTGAVKILLAAGANKLAVNALGLTPIDIATEDKSQDMIKLLKNGPEVAP